jgi:aconitate hydratase
MTRTATRSSCAMSGPRSAEIQRTMPRAQAGDVPRAVRQRLRRQRGFQRVKVAGGELFEWDPKSTYIKEPPFFTITREVPPVQPITGARVLAIMPDSTTTDHISPAGNIARNSPAARYLEERRPARRVEQLRLAPRQPRVMMRGTLPTSASRTRCSPPASKAATHLHATTSSANVRRWRSGRR